MATTCLIGEMPYNQAGSWRRLHEQEMPSIDSNLSRQASGCLLDRVMVQEATQHLVALHLKREGWLGGIIKAKWNDIAQPLVRPVAVMVGLNFAQSPVQVRLPQQNQLVEGLTDFSHVTLGIRIAERSVRWGLEHPQLCAAQ